MIGKKKVLIGFTFQRRLTSENIFKCRKRLHSKAGRVKLKSEADFFAISLH